MAQAFETRQFKAGNSQAVRIPAEMAFPAQTALRVWREGNRIIVEPVGVTLEGVPALLGSLGSTCKGERPEVLEKPRL